MPELRTDIEIIVADVSIEESLAIMCQQGLVILNCVGPVSIPSARLSHRLHTCNTNLVVCGVFCPFSTGFMVNQWSKLA